MKVTANGRLVDALDDTVMMLIPDGMDALTEVVLGDPAALAFYLDAAKSAPLEVAGVAPDCRQSLIPVRFTGRFVGLTEPLGEFEDTGIAFAFQPDGYEEPVALPFGWLAAIRVAA